MTDIVSVYGQTESAPGSTMSACGDPLDLRCNTVGYAFPHIECKIIDPETGEEVPDGVNGEFCSRGYNTMKGYYKMPEATAATSTRRAGCTPAIWPAGMKTAATASPGGSRT